MFFPNLHNKYDGGGDVVGGLTALKRMKTQETRLYMAFTSLTKFDTPHVAAKKRETRKELLPNKYQII